MLSEYQRCQRSCLSPPSSRIAVRRGSNANSTRMCPPRGRSSFILGWREALSVSTSGRPSAGPPLQELDGGGHALLLGGAELVPLRRERVGVLDLPHRITIRLRL